MFSLITLYIEYRKMRASRPQALATAATKTVRCANDGGANRAAATAA